MGNISTAEEIAIDWIKFIEFALSYFVNVLKDENNSIEGNMCMPPTESGHGEEDLLIATFWNRTPVRSTVYKHHEGQLHQTLSFLSSKYGFIRTLLNNTFAVVNFI